MNMNKKVKKIIIGISLFAVLLVLTGCTQIPTDPVTKEPIYITLETTYGDLAKFKSGIFDYVLIYPLAQAINFLSDKFGVFGGVALVTLILNLILLIFTFKSSESMQRMQMIQPEIDRIQKKYEGQDSQAAKAQMSMEMQRIFEKNDINPLASLTSLLQLPILLCMYSAIRRSYAVAHGTFLGVSLAITPKEAFVNKQVAIIAIYISMVVFQLLSAILPQLIANLKKKRLANIQHKPYEKTKNNNMFMMYGMIVLIAIMMLNWQAALSLYYAIVSLINILKTLVIEIIMQKKEVKN